MIDQALLCDYLLFLLNKDRNQSYVDYMGIDEPVDNLRVFMNKVARANPTSMIIKKKCLETSK